MDIQCGLFWKDQEEKKNFKLLKILYVFLSGKHPCASHVANLVPFRQFLDKQYMY